VDIGLTVTNAVGTASAVLHLAIAKPAGSTNIAPAISSPPAASPATGIAAAAVTFTAAGSDADGDLLTYAWDFGDGTTGSGASAAHVYAAPGIYTVTVTADDGVVKTSDTLVFAVSAPEEPGGAASPVEWVVGPMNAFAVRKGSVKLNFAHSLKDTLTLSGTVPLGKYFRPQGKMVIVQSGALRKEFPLNSKGQGATGLCKFGLRGKIKKGVFTATPAAFALTIRCEPLSVALQDCGLTDKTTSKAGDPVTMPVIIMVDQTGYTANAKLTYKATATKGGLAKVLNGK
jgi:hypothetical protein